MSDTELPEKVSREAHERVLHDRDEARTKLAEATQALQDTKLLFEAQAFFSGKVKDPMAAAELTLPKLRSLEDSDARMERLEASVPLFAPLSTPEVTAEAVEPGNVVPDAPPTPSFMRPNPSSDGPPPTAPKYTLRSPEVEALKHSPEGQAKIRQMVESGQIEFSPLNRTASNR